MAEINPEAKRQIQEAFERLCRNIESPEIQMLFAAPLGISYELTDDRLLLTNPEGPVISMEPWVVASIAWVIDYIMASFPEPREFMAAALGFVLLYKTIFHHVTRMARVLKQEGKTMEEISEFMGKNLPSLWRDVPLVSDEQMRALIAQGLAMEGGYN